MTWIRGLGSEYSGFVLDLIVKYQEEVGRGTIAMEGIILILSTDLPYFFH